MAKLRADRAMHKARDRWQSFALAALPECLATTPWVLYAMQMQPESSIDVWGYPWNDQVSLIQNAADALTKGEAKLVVKLNPSAKYELNMELCNLAQTHPNIVPLSLSCPMEDIFIHAHAILSVVGTVLIEAIMAGKPVGVLGEHEYARLPGVTALAAPSEITRLINASGKARAATPSMAENILKEWYAQSYDAVLYDPLNQPEWATRDNLDNLAKAFRHILSLLNSTPREKAGKRIFALPLSLSVN